MICPNIPDASVTLRIQQPASEATTRGTVVLTTGGDGTRFYRGAPPGVGQMVDTLIAEGFTVVEIAWDAPGIWGGARARTLACRYATVTTWVRVNMHRQVAGSVFIAQGTSGGASQIAFGLAYYGLGEIIDLANLGGGPPFCPLCAPTPGASPEPLLSGTPQLGSEYDSAFLPRCGRAHAGHQGQRTRVLRSHYVNEVHAGPARDCA